MLDHEEESDDSCGEMDQREDGHEHPIIMERGMEGSGITIEEEDLKRMDDSHREIPPQRTGIAGIHTDIVCDKSDEPSNNEDNEKIATFEPIKDRLPPMVEHDQEEKGNSHYRDTDIRTGGGERKNLIDACHLMSRSGMTGSLISMLSYSEEKTGNLRDQPRSSSKEF